MIIGELSQFNASPDAQTNEAPFVYKSFPGTFTIADYWRNIFGAPDESRTLRLNIISFIESFSIFYVLVDNLQSCIETEMSLYWDTGNNILYIHYSHNSYRFYGNYEYEDTVGFTDKTVVYINNIKYQPLIKSIPSIAQQQDIINYDRPAFVNGSVEHDNTDGLLDYLIEKEIIGSDYRLSYLDDSDNLIDYSRDDLTPLASLFIEDWEFKLQSLSLLVQDIRKKQNVKIPTETFSSEDYPDINENYDGNIIPLMFGQIRYSEGIPVDGDTGVGNDVTFRQALLLTSLGTVQVEIDNLWTTKVPTSTDLSTGSFTLAEADGRQANGEPYKCRVYNSIGIVNTFSSDIIKYLNERYLGFPYNVGLYDTSEWEAEEIQLESIGIIFNEQIELYDAIKTIQSNSNVGFRYEINATGKRTIRIDDNDRGVSNYFSNTEIVNIQDINIATQANLLSAIVKVNYAYDYYNKKYLSVENDDYADYVNQNYRQQPQIEIDTNLITQPQAEARAELYASIFSTMPLILSLSFGGSDKYTLRIYDIIESEISIGMIDAASGDIMEGREFFGVWKMKILSIDPQFEGIRNNITAQLLEKLDSITAVRITEDGAIRILENPIGTVTIKRGI